MKVEIQNIYGDTLHLNDLTPGGLLYMECDYESHIVTLNRPQVAELIEHLQAWHETGSLEVKNV